ncbi:hypothetical protein C2S53_016633 [Perilla frutescens var. hirtella]|uniref:Pectinesterase inhibitor domain-containing protein n=1 Tax=Perilla frutescens var. hirtella TaxID=608512 RepID=A0AAD4P203_PERFH|nr:hypothetical protein C2S53_016633 [Perilla frutescens var. hirtella]
MLLSRARKIAVMSILLAVAQAQRPTPKTEVEKEIQEMCRNTTVFPEECTETLWKGGPNTSDPRILMQINMEAIIKEANVANLQIAKTHNDSSCIDFMPSAIKYFQESIDQLKSASAAPINKEALKYSVFMGCAELLRCQATFDYDMKLSVQMDLLLQHPIILSKNSVQWAKAFLLN